MRTSSLALLLPLAACGQRDGEAARAAEQRQLEAAPKFFCASGEQPLSAQCTAERVATDTGWTLTVRHPDGHFRRLQVSADGRDVRAADGAEPATVNAADPAAVEVAIGGDRYRLPVIW